VLGVSIRVRIIARPRAQSLGQRISLKFSLETRLKSESFEP